MADALIGNVQEKSMNKYNASTTEMIFYSKGIGSVFLLVALVAAVHAQESGVRTTREAAATAVVFNPRDPESRGLAEYYAERRAIPPENIIGLDCPLEEEISRKDYVETIEKPLRAVFERKEWWGVRTGFGDKQEISGSRIRFMVPLLLLIMITGWPWHLVWWRFRFPRFW
jgi:hypothetical protein